MFPFSQQKRKKNCNKWKKENIAQTVKKHSKPNAQDPKGGIKEKEAAIHISNISLILPDGKTTRVGFKYENNIKIRYSKKTNEPL